MYRLISQGNRVLTEEAFVPAIADPDVIGVNNKEKRPACSPSSFRRRPESRPAFRHMGDRRRKPVSLDSGFRRNDAGGGIFGPQDNKLDAIALAIGIRHRASHHSRGIVGWMFNFLGNCLVCTAMPLTTFWNSDYRKGWKLLSLRLEWKGLIFRACKQCFHDPEPGNPP